MMMLVIKIIALVELIFVGVKLIRMHIEEKKQSATEKEEEKPDNVVVGTIQTGTIKTGTIGTMYPDIEVSHVQVPDIVRCKDCKYYCDSLIGSYCALYNLQKNGGDWYCASGQKKVDGGKRMIDVDELLKYLGGH